MRHDVIYDNTLLMGSQYQLEAYELYNASRDFILFIVRVYSVRNASISMIASVTVI